jgi:phytoene desaturase
METLTVRSAPPRAAVARGPDTRPHAVVIGSGFGGLAAAVRLGARGYRVTVLERLDAPGGRARVHRQDGFTFDAGPTIVTAPFLFDELWALRGRRLADDVELVPLSPFLPIALRGRLHLRLFGRPCGDARRSGAAQPRRRGGYERFMRLSQEACRIGFEQLGHVPFGSLGAMARVVPALVRLGGLRSVHGLVARHVRTNGCGWRSPSIRC